MDARQDSNRSGPNFESLPESLILSILNYLSPFEVGRVGQCSHKLKRVCSDEVLWRRLFHCYFCLSRTFANPTGHPTWRGQEFIRLIDEIPIVEAQVLTEHTDEVLYVSYSHNGEMFATTSKDGFVQVWNSRHPVNLKYSHDMKQFGWSDARFSQFNEVDSLLLVSGALSTTCMCRGEIAIFSIEDKFQIQNRVRTKPFDTCGFWYSETSFFSSNLSELENLETYSLIYLNKVVRDTESEQVAPVILMYKFRSPRVCMPCVRYLMVANCVDELSSSSVHSPFENQSSNSEVLPSQSDLIGVNEGTLQKELHEWKPFKPTVEKRHESTPIGPDTDSIIGPRDKWLIFTRGSETYVSHQIGFKRIPHIGLKSRVDFAPNSPGVRHQFDSIDHTIDLHGQIIGMTLSPEHRYLKLHELGVGFPWPPIAEEIDIHVIDLTTLRNVAVLRGGHRAYTPIDSFSYQFLDASKSYLTSGAGDKYAYLWERNYGISLGKLPHEDAVNAVAFDSTNSEMIVSVSDDHTAKVWRSRKQCRELGIDITGLTEGIKLHLAQKPMAIPGVE